MISPSSLMMNHSRAVYSIGMSTTAAANQPSVPHLDERDRQTKQEEMIRQYLQVANTETTPTPPIAPPASTTIAPVSFDFQDLRKELKLGEERVERLRQELKDLQTKRDESFVRTPPPYTFPTVNNPSSELLHHQLSPSMNLRLSDRTTPPPPALMHELYSAQQQSSRPLLSNSIPSSSSLLMGNLNIPVRLPTTSADLSKDQRHRQFLLTMHQHREQLLVYLDSLKQALNSLDRLASLEPTRSEVQLANMKLETIQQKSRQLRALKSTRSPQQSPFIHCRIRQLERDLVYMLTEHQKDVQSKLELNEQRSLMLLKIMQVTDELASLDQQIQQILPMTSADLHRLGSSPPGNEFNSAPTFTLLNPNHTHQDGRRVSFRESTDSHPLTKVSPPFYPHRI